MFEKDLFGGVATPQKQGSILSDTWEYPPFSVLSAREGWWQERKRQWLSLGIKSELGRGGGNDSNGKTDALSPGGSARPAADYSNRQRGDGRGRPL